MALAYKPNAAFYANSSKREMLEDTLNYIQEHAPDVPVILDGKRNDIGNTNRGYIEEAFEEGFDAVTVNPYLGMEAMQPFFEQKDKGIIVLCKTSNAGADEFQDLDVVNNDPTGGFVSTKFYKIVAENVATKWNYNGNCALVVGATHPTDIGQVRNIVGDMWILIPGVGTQGGDLEASVRNGVNSKGSGIVINSSSGIIFAKDPRAATQKLTGEINAVLATL